ncbi:hypothetical protein BHYA_0231g00050 [Botrytis hyacinthi]|uniref:Uncharacterized protein n=1 Tax=Botrytis hyacinthi TaxID=278943 RepID=A0A4Z1GI81_9HELO|nr:hypothetical protein BHYA_0231g00050 [Botrytis hyacinthi]
MKLSPPGWVLTIIITVTIATRIIDMIDSSNTMKELSTNSPEAVQSIFFSIGGSGCILEFGGEWVKVVIVELETLVLLAGAMAFA